jgi:hypothetical protein
MPDEVFILFEEVWGDDSWGLEATRVFSGARRLGEAQAHQREYGGILVKGLMWVDEETGASEPAPEIEEGGDVRGGTGVVAAGAGDGAGEAGRAGDRK